MGSGSKLVGERGFDRHNDRTTDQDGRSGYEGVERSRPSVRGARVASAADNRHQENGRAHARVERVVQDQVRERRDARRRYQRNSDPQEGPKVLGGEPPPISGDGRQPECEQVGDAKPDRCCPDEANLLARSPSPPNPTSTESSTMARYKPTVAASRTACS